MGGKDDSILKAEIACEIPVTFHAAVPQDVTRQSRLQESM